MADEPLHQNDMQLLSSEADLCGLIDEEHQDTWLRESMCTAYHFCLLSYPPWPPSKPAGLSTVAIMFISFVWAANSSGRLHTKLLTPVTLRDEKQTFCSLNK